MQHKAAVVAPVAEKWLSARAGRVQIPGQTLAFFGSGHFILTWHGAVSNYGFLEQCHNLPFFAVSYHNLTSKPNNCN